MGPAVRQDRIEGDLLSAAKVEAGSVVLIRRPVSRRRWFAARVNYMVKVWLDLAAQPAVREVAQELGELKARLWAALHRDAPEAVAKAADAYKGLSPAARGALRGRDHPPPQAIRDGDHAALTLLFGLIPVAAGTSLDGPKPFVTDADYQGPGQRELNQPGRPRDVRLEQLFDQLAIIYELATGRRATLGASSPFEAFVGLLLSFLSADDISERGHRALRRTIQWRNSLVFRDNRPN